MKRLIIFLLYLLFSCNSSYSQVNFKPEIGINCTGIAFGSYNANKIPSDEFVVSDEDRFNSQHPAEYKYIGVESMLGVRLTTKVVSFIFQVGYMWFKDVSSSLYDSIEKGRKSGLLGLDFSFRILEQKRIKPTLTIQMFKEIHSNYEDKAFFRNSFFPAASVPMEMFYSEYQGHGAPSKTSFSKTVYKDTPFLGNIYIGCDIGLVKNLNLSISTGYNMSIINYKYVKFEYDDYVKTDYMTLLKGAPIRRVLIHSWSFQLGLSYTFDIHKKQPKTTTP